ncbi:leucine-rich repeat protein [Anaerocolumna sedimenticola]|uniref:Leucine-rich repeat protein n=1 Tax=Anaerocolumna sedimenticola TaxID=2696063 RepID=A0A6P1TG49_9FIRM|nr:leucine-rich repeat protein [Anaerocolumna sedimenticola]QHQ60114.1 leucine-rich repeat protein [Anaerocolumna sedimenticola]
MNKKGKNILAILIIAGVLLILKGITAEAYVGSTFTYAYDNQTLTYKVLSEPTETENGTAEVINEEGSNEKLSGEVNIPQTVTNRNMTYNVIRIEDEAFMDAVNITGIKLPDKITYIGEDAFRNCAGLANINIPDGVTGIEDGTFSGCSSLKSMHLPDRVSYIGNSAFKDCGKLTGINLPEAVKKIGRSAFSGCSSLTSVNIPEGVTGLEDEVFQDCSNLTSVMLPDSIKSIGKYAFNNCISLKNIHLSDEITSIGEYAFSYCSSLTSIKIPYKVTKIENRTFIKCTGLTTIRIQDRITSIGDFAFYGCSSLISISIPENVTSIGNFTFQGCDNLRPIKIPSQVTSIGVGKFPYTGVLVYKNSYAETFFEKNFPEYYQIINLPLEEMVFSEDVKNIGVGDTVTLKPDFYPAFSSDITGNIIWTSSNPHTVSVDANGSVRGLSSGEADISAAMGKYQATCHIIVGGTALNPTSITIDEKNLAMNKGESTKLHLDFTPADSTNRMVTWKSSDNSVVTVDNGRIYAKAPGTATITAISGTASANCRITVYNPLKEIYSDYNEMRLNKGETKRIAVSYYPMDTTDDKTVVWRSEDESIAMVEDGIIKAIRPGKTTIIATVGTLTHSIPVSVLAPVKSITFSQASVALTAGQKQTVTLDVQPVDTTDNLVITSTDESVATYSEGIITAKKRGKATITAVCGSLSASIQVTVGTDIKSISLNKQNLNLYLGTSETLTVTYNPANPADDKTVTWASSDETVVKVDSKGKIQTVGTGTATLTAIAGGNKKASCSVTVKLSVPAALKAVSGGFNSTKISWGTVSGASGYEVYKADSKTGAYKIIKATTAKSFTNTGLTTGKTYYYKVRAYRYKGTKKVYSSFSEIAGAKPVPSTPGDVKLVKVSSGRISFTWNKVSGASGYEIYRASSKTKTYSRVKSTTSLHFINYGLTKGRTYYYKVRAYKIIGNQKVYSKFSAIFPIKI